MALKNPDPNEATALLDAAEISLATVVDRTVRVFTRKVSTAAQAQTMAGRTTLTAAGNEPLDLLTLGEMYGWWSQGVTTGITPEIQRIIRRAYRTNRTGPYTQRTQQVIGEYLSNVTDRLVRGLTPPLPDAAFDAIRGTLTQAQLEGWSRRNTAQRIAAEMGWETDGPYWRRELARIDEQIDSILDPMGPPGSNAREAARLSDPTVQALRNDRNHAIRILDAEHSYWGRRANLISRTETTSSWGYGTLQALIDEEAEYKTWVATHDARTRPTHIYTNGETVRIDQPFSVGGFSLMYPGDPAAPPEEICNCRCTLIASEGPE